MRRKKPKRMYIKKPSRNWNDPQYKAWRKSIYDRDGHKCQMTGCKYRGKRINAHHIRKWADFPHLRYDINNGITLCYGCHKRITGRELLFAPMLLGIISSKDKR